MLFFLSFGGSRTGFRYNETQVCIHIYCTAIFTILAHIFTLKSSHLFQKYEKVRKREREKIQRKYIMEEFVSTRLVLKVQA